MPSPIGQRIHVLGNTGAGKSTLAAQLAEVVGVPFVELDALNWLPGWIALDQTDPDEFRRRLAAATSGDGWVVGGSYSRPSEAVFWDRLDTVVWLDLPLLVILRRVVMRSWRRWRTRELLWGTNTERLWPHLKLWSQDSLIYWAISSHRRRRARLLAAMADPRWSHIRFVRLTSSREVDAFRRAVADACAAPNA